MPWHLSISRAVIDGQAAHNPQLNAYLAAGSFNRAMSRASTLSGVTVYADAHEEIPESRCGCTSGFG